jgi:membrane protein YdbS with pleckstrin-like domain
MPEEIDPLTGDTQPHRPAEDAEKVFYEGSPLLRSEFASGWPWMLGGLIVIAGPIVFYVMGNPERKPFPWWVLAITTAIGLLLLLVPWIKTKTVSYKVTNYRIDIDRGLISRRIDTLELWHVNDIRLTQGLLERILGVGTITIYSGDNTSPQLPLRGVPNPKPLFESMKQRIIAVKRQRGVVKMDIG